MNTVAGAWNLAIQCEKQRDGVFRDRVRRVRRNPRDRNPELGRGVDVDAVVAGASKRNMFHAARSKCFKARPIASVIYENADGPRPLDGRCGFR